MIPRLTRPGSKGEKGFDCNATVTSLVARAMRDANFTFAVRYLPRITAKAIDLTPTEVDVITSAGLGIIGVQHFEGDGWTPTFEKGSNYGKTAAAHAAMCGLVNGTHLFLDLEGVNKDVDHQVIIEYCNEWHHEVSAAGFKPGLYVGWDCRLTPKELYYKLAFDCYWAAYNLDTRLYPVVRGVCMQQSSGKAPTGVKLSIDVNEILGDHLGGYPTMTVADLQFTLPLG